MHSYIYMYIHICTYACVYRCMYTHVYTNIYVHAQELHRSRQGRNLKTHSRSNICMHVYMFCIDAHLHTHTGVKNFWAWGACT